MIVHRRWHVLLLAAAATAGALAMYSGTLGYGFDYDDYHFVRPYPAAEILQAFRGSWDPSGIEVAFFRPLTIVLYAARFRWFGLNAPAYHALSVAMFAVAGWILSLVLLRLVSGRGAWLGLAFLLVHPSMPYAATAWVTNQMHLLQMIVVLSAVLWWSHVRGRSGAWWLPLLGFEAAALLVKEDGVMLVPAIVALHLLRRLLVERDLRLPPTSFLLSAVVVGGALLAYRQHALHGIGGYALPGAMQAWVRYHKGLDSVFRLVPAARPWQTPASWFVTLVPVAALVCWRRAAPAARFGIAAGATIAALFNLPFVFVVKVEQMYLVATGAAVVLAASVEALLTSLSASAAFAVLVPTVGGFLMMASVSRNITRDFEPFGAIVLAHDRLTDWAAVPVELRDYLEEKRAPGASLSLSSNPAVALDTVWFGLHAWELTPEGARFRWMSGSWAELLLTPAARLVEIPVRHDIAVLRAPARISIEVDGAVQPPLMIDDGEWHVSTIALHPRFVAPLMRMHRIVLRIDRTWIPAEMIAGSGDTRVLGEQIGVVTLRY